MRDIVTLAANKLQKTLGQPVAVVTVRDLGDGELYAYGHYAKAKGIDVETLAMLMLSDIVNNTPDDGCVHCLDRKQRAGAALAIMRGGARPAGRELH